MGMNVLRRVCGESCLVVTNEVVHNLCNVEKRLGGKEESVLIRWYGHAIRMNEGGKGGGSKRLRE